MPKPLGTITVPKGFTLDMLPDLVVCVRGDQTVTLDPNFKGTPMTVVPPSAEMTPENAERLRELWRAAYTGPKLAGMLVLADEPVNPDPECDTPAIVRREE